MNRSRPRIVVVGSINTDLVVRCERLPKPGETVIANEYAQIAGGKGANQAVAAARLGADVMMVGRVGDDEFGVRALRSLADEGIDTTHVQITENTSSGLAVIGVEQTGENSIMVVPGANGHVSERDVTEATDAIANCNILLLQLEIPFTVVKTAITTARAHGVRVILDPAPISAPLASDVLDVEVICPNQAEASELLGSEIESVDDAREAARQLVRLGPRAAVITLGDKGAVFADGDSATWVEPIPVDAVDTTAAGDAFAAALGLCLTQGASLDEAVRFACAAGAIAASRHGAQPSLPTLAEVEDSDGSGL
ncbi:MAG: ribokinase [Pirellulales bacterium]|nr:ribokinase [Pirellulales bacterium]